DFPVCRPEIMEFYNDSNWIEKGKQLLIYGNYGNYKTSHAIQIALKIIREYQWKCLYYKTSELPKLLMNDNSVENNIKSKNTKLVIWDNFGKEGSEKFGGKVFDALEWRIHNFLSNILIVNADLKVIEEIYGGAMASRILAFIHVPMDGEDKRSKIKFGRK
ncbi:unnamed protein product, partial [marine sediment metagenome]